VGEAGNVRPGRSASESAGDGSKTSTGELVAQASRQIRDLVRQELALAKAELAEKKRHAGLGAGLFGGAGVVAFYGGGVLIAAAVAALALVWPVWLAALVVGLVLLAIAGVLSLTGRRQLGQAAPPLPEHATASVKTDIHEIKDHLSERHQT
jgi:uncharacterized membrane protein YqjE